MNTRRHSFRLEPLERDDVAPTIEFEAYDMTDALSRAQHLLSPCHSFRLLRNGSLLATLTHTDEGYWSVARECIPG